jgi:serine protease Do
MTIYRMPRLLVAALIALMAGCATSPTAGPDFTALIEQTKQSVVNISDGDTSRGTVFVVHSNGYILTARHVIDGTEKLSVTLSSGLSLEARVAASDDVSDLAILTIADAQPLRALQLHSGPPLRVGEWVIVLGNPFGLGLTASAGIVGAVGATLGNANPDGWIQTDASINPGNSGGPVIDTAGNVIGIASAQISMGNGAGFITPAESAHRLLKNVLPGE